MTAIAGCWEFGGRAGTAAACRRMLAAQKIYGPHDEASWNGGEIALGRQLYRLLPEDRYDRGVQASADGRHRLIADVRVDNRAELTKALGLDGATAATMPDAAFLLAAWRQWDEGMLDRVVGDFAFALWDETEQKLFLARDFLGQRPLHYHRGEHFFAFATMPKGLHALPDIPYAPDEQHMAEFVTLMPVGDSRSFFEGIELVRAGHVATVTRQGMTSRRYWQPSRREVRQSKASDFVEGLRHHLDEATRARLRGTDGLVGSQLSAGFDSAAVTATAARLLALDGGKVVAFTSVPREGFDGPPPRGRLADEGPLAAETAAMHANVEQVLIRGSGSSPVDDLDRNFLLFDRPGLNLCNMVWMSAINDAASDRKITVMLTGQMGNMTISYGGLERLPQLLRAGRIVRLWRESVRMVSRGILSWKGAVAATFGPFAPRWLWRFVSEMRNGSWDLFQYTAIQPKRLRDLDLPRLAKERNLDFSYRPWRNGFDVRLWVLRRIDPGSHNKGVLAGWGIDQRDPTADKRLVEYCLSVPMEQYLRDGETRSLGRRALCDRIPQSVLNAPCKGYQAADWHEGLTAARADIEREVGRLAPCEPAARTLDVDRLRKLVEEWPQSGWEQQSTISAYRLALLRGISAGHFLRKVAGTNQ